MRLLKLVLIVACAVPTTIPAWAQGPATQPMVEPQGEGEPFTPGRFGRGRFRGLLEAPNRDDWAEVTAFMRDRCPRRWAIFEQLPDDSPRRDAINRFIHARYRNLQFLRRYDPDLYELRVRQLELEDTVFGMVMDLKLNRSAQETQTIQSGLRQKVAELVDLAIQERRRRIERLEQAVDVERQKLERDEGNRDGLIDEKLRRVTTDPGESMHGETMTKPENQ